MAVQSGVGYSGTPLQQKLGIEPGSRVLRVTPPGGFAPEPLPDGGCVQRRPGPARYDVILAFPPDREALERRVVPPGGTPHHGRRVVDRLPKRASGMTSDLDENIVRGGGLAIAWVDSTVCAVNATWSGLRFVPRLVDR